MHCTNALYSYALIQACGSWLWFVIVAVYYRWVCGWVGGGGVAECACTHTIFVLPPQHEHLPI
jgi:hypothetical protein